MTRPPASNPKPSPTHKQHRSLADVLTAISIVGDLLVVFGGLCLGYWIRFDSGWIRMGNESARITVSDYLGLISIGSIFLILTFAYLKLYEQRRILNFRQVLPVILQGTTFWLFAYLGLSLTLKFEPAISRIYVLSSFVSALVVVLAWRYLFYRFCLSERIAKNLRQRILFIGWNEEADRLANAIRQAGNHPYEIVGCIPPPQTGFQLAPPPDIEASCAFERLNDLLSSGEVDIAVLADLNFGTEDITALANHCEKEYVQFKVIPSYFQILVSGLQLETISGVPILGVTELPLDRLTNRILKRAVDVAGGVIGLLLAAPLILVFGGIVYFESPGPIFYRQVRTGRNGRDFKIIKIRSMRLDAETKGGAQWAQENDPRRLRIGSFMRAWNIDEVPQFWNVLKGEMSLVGPRPERPELIENFKDEIPHYNARHASKPGITGWAQVNGLRGNTSLTERVRYDLFYLENWSLWLDFQIMLLTFFKRDNAY